MKIALTIPRLPLSGVGTSVNIIERGLRDAGYIVDVLITGHEAVDDFKFAEQSGWNLKIPGYGVRYLPERLERIAEMLHTNGYSIVINNGSVETQLILPCLGEEMIRVGVMRVLNRDALRYIAMNSEYLHCAVGISAEMTRVMAADERIKTTVRLIPNCTRVQGGDFPRLNKKLKICYMGRISNPDKNVRILPHIARSLKSYGVDFVLEVVGDGPARKMLERDFNRLAAGYAVFKGMVPREEAIRIMSHCHFVLLPSISEGLSNVMLEGMAMGCVPVCSDIENFRWVLGEAAERLQCRLHTPEDYAERIIYMIKNLDTYGLTQSYLSERQKRNFTPERTLHGYLDLIRELSSGQAPEMPLSCDFNELRIPIEYRMYCSAAWRMVQRVKDAFGKNA